MNKIETLAQKIRVLGEASNYKEQASLFLSETGSDITIREAVPQRKAPWTTEGNCGIHYSVEIKKDKNHSYTFDFWGSIADKLNNHRGFPKRPSAYDILTCLHDGNGIENYGDFCSTFGYDEDSRNVYSTYESVKDQKENIARIFTIEELEALNEIS